MPGDIRPYKGIMPKLAEGVFIDPSAVIIGDVEIGKDSSVWCNAVIRGDVNYIRIGARTNVQDLSMLHVTKDTYPLIIGDEVTIGHSVTLHGCVIGNRILIGMGAVILDGAKVGDDCVIAAGSLVPERAEIPAGWLVMGAPAKPKRQLTDEEKLKLKMSADNYVQYKLDYI